MERVLVVDDDGRVLTLGTGPIALPAGGFDLLAHEDAIVREAMRLHDHNQSEAARFLHLTRSKLRSRLERRPSA